MKRLLILIPLLLTFHVASAQRIAHPTTDLLLHTRDGWQVTGRLTATCRRVSFDESDCNTSVAEEPAQPTFVYPLPGEGVILLSVGDFALSAALELRLQPADSDEVVDERTIPTEANAEIEWQLDLPAGEYILSVDVYPEDAPEFQYMTYKYPVRILTDDEAEAFFPSPPPLLLYTVDNGWVEGLHGSYCFPSGDDMGCVDVAQRPVPEAYESLPQGKSILLQLAAQPYPERLTFMLYSPEGGAALAQLDYDVTNDLLDYSWIPDVPTGDYVLAVSVQWAENTDALYIFGVTITEPSTPPQFSLWTANNDIVGGEQGSYCWGDGLSALCVDYMFPLPEVYHPLLEGNILYIVVQSNNFPDSVHASLLTPDMEMVFNSEMRAPEPGVYSLVVEDVPAGDYILMIGGFWEEGDSSNVFGVRIEP